MPKSTIGEPIPTLAYLMTDIAGSTRLWENNREGMALSLVRLDRISEETFEQAGGRLIRSRGEGDSYFGVFESADDALTAATNLLLAIKRDPSLRDILLHTAIHAGSAETWAGDYYGPTVNRCARIREVCHPGQILVSEAGCVLASSSGAFAFKDLGVHRLRDLMQPERLFQLLHPELPSDFPNPNTLTTLSHNLPSHPTSFIGREQDIRRLGETVRLNRLTTVTGAGGAGKTRLTIQVAADCIGEF
jgi:class 3 adenylate cyclase